MSQCVWCDLGQHVFPYGQKGSTTLKVTEQVRNQWGGTQPQDVVKDVCASCASDYGYTNLANHKTDEQLDKEAQDIRRRSGGLVREDAKALEAAEDPVEEAEEENDRLRMSRMEDELIELRALLKPKTGTSRAKA